MNRRFHHAPFLLIVLAFLAAPIARAQTANQDAKQPHARIALYRVAPGKHLEFLKWLTDRDAIDKEAGVPASKIYAHTDGDSWDYLQVVPELSKEQEAKIDELTRKRGLKTGFAASLEFRTFVAWHTDTDTIGPVNAADLVALAGK